MLFVPGAQAQEIFTLAETIRTTERAQAGRIRAGISLRHQLQFSTYLTQRQNTPSLSFRDYLRTSVEPSRNNLPRVWSCPREIWSSAATGTRPI